MLSTRTRLSRFMSPPAAVISPPARPPLAQLSSAHRSSRALPPSLSPLFIDSLTRSTLPSATLSTQYAPPDLSHPSSAESSPFETVSRPLNLARRSLSSGNLSRATDLVGLEGGSELWRSRRQSAGSPHPNVNPVVAQEADSPNLSDLSWGVAWWPFKVVEPEAAGVDTAESGLTARSILQLFAGTGPVEAATRREARHGPAERAEAALAAGWKQLPLDSGPSSSSQPSSPIVASARHQPSRMLSSTSLRSLPTLSSPVSPPASARPRPPHHGRHYSTGPGTSREQVSGYLDEEDKKTAQVEEENEMDMFDLIRDRYRAPKYPIVFAHGLFGFDTIGPASIKPLQFSYWSVLLSLFTSCFGL